MDAASFLSAGEVREISGLARQALATEYALQGGTFRITIRRWNEDTERIEPLPETYPVVIRYANLQANESISESSQSSQTSGEVAGVAPLPLQVGDRFTLPGGTSAIVSEPAPREEFGIVTGFWQTAGGTV